MKPFDVPEGLTGVSGRAVAVLSAVWGGGLFLVLQLQYLPLPGRYSHYVCGPWGCGPPLQALLACHGFWLMVLSLPTVLGCRLLSLRKLVLVGVIGTALGMLGVAGVAIWEAVNWLPHAGQWQKPYFVQRWMFALGTLVDVPIVEVLMAGLACLVAARVRQGRRKSEADTRADGREAAEPVLPERAS